MIRNAAGYFKSIEKKIVWLCLMLLNYLSPHPFTIAFDCLKRKWAVYFWLCKLHFDIETLFSPDDSIVLTPLGCIFFQSSAWNGFFVIFFIDVTYWHLDKNTFFMLRSKKIYQKSVNHINSLDTQRKEIKQFGFGSMYDFFAWWKWNCSWMWCFATALLMDVIKLQYLLALQKHIRLIFFRFIQESRVEFLLKLLSIIIMNVKNTKLTFERKEMRIKPLEEKKMLRSRLKDENNFWKQQKSFERGKKCLREDTIVWEANKSLESTKQSSREDAIVQKAKKPFESKKKIVRKAKKSLERTKKVLERNNK